jgi:hypothetical protein
VKTVTVRLNKQQLELLDGSVDRIGAGGRRDVLLTALREHARELIGPSSPAANGRERGDD